MSSPPTSTWQDRRGMFQRGKEVHPSDSRFSGSSGTIAETVRKASISSMDSIEKTISAASPSSPDASKAAPSLESSTGSPSTAQRRRSSNAGMFGNLVSHKRGSEDYHERRASHSEQLQSAGGVFSGWYGTTFRGVKPVEDKQPEGVSPTIIPTSREPVPSVWQDRRGMFQKGKEQ